MESSPQPPQNESINDRLASLRQQEARLDKKIGTTQTLCMCGAIDSGEADYIIDDLTRQLEDVRRRILALEMPEIYG